VNILKHSSLRHERLIRRTSRLSNIRSSNSFVILDIHAMYAQRTWLKAERRFRADTFITLFKVDDTSATPHVRKLSDAPIQCEQCGAERRILACSRRIGLRCASRLISRSSSVANEPTDGFFPTRQAQFGPRLCSQTHASDRTQLNHFWHNPVAWQKPHESRVQTQRRCGSRLGSD